MNKKNKKKFVIIFFGILCMLVGIGIFIFSLYKDIEIQKLEEQFIQDFYEEQYNEEGFYEENKINEHPSSKNTKKENKSYIAILEIPKINLKQGIPNKESYYNSVDKGIQLLQDSDMPDQEKGNVILASHSGNSRVSYFKRVAELEKEDEVLITFNGKIYFYKVVNSYEVLKNGTVQITRNAEHNTLTLITCKPKTDKQIVVICELHSLEDLNEI